MLNYEHKARLWCQCDITVLSDMRGQQGGFHHVIIMTQSLKMYLLQFSMDVVIALFDRTQDSASDFFADIGTFLLMIKLRTR
jgi:hypothetical protein